MAWQLTEDLETFLTTAGGFLRARPAANTIMLTAMERLRAAGAAAFGDVTPVFGWLASTDGSVAAAFMHTPPYPVVLTDMTAAAAAELAADLAGRGHRAPGVNAMPALGAAPAAARHRQDRGCHGPRPAAGLAPRVPGRGAAGRAERVGAGGERPGRLGRAGALGARRQAGLAGRAQPARRWPGPGRPGLHAAGPARPRIRRRGHGRDHPGRAGRRRRGRGAVHRPGEPHEQHVVPAPRLPPDQQLDRDPLRRPPAMTIMLKGPSG